MIGMDAGAYDTGSSKLYIDSLWVSQHPLDTHYYMESLTLQPFLPPTPCCGVKGDAEFYANVGGTELSTGVLTTPHLRSEPAAANWTATGSVAIGTGVITVTGAGTLSQAVLKQVGGVAATGYKRYLLKMTIGAVTTAPTTMRP